MADKKEQPETLTITLRKPVVIGDQVYDHLDLREPTSGEFRKMSKLAASDPAGSLIELISAVSGIAVPIIEKIGVRDMNDAGNYLMFFIQSGQPTTSN
jgi:hypothetical protein